MIFEARFRTSTITGTIATFIGLIEDTAGTNAVPITQDGDVLSDNNLVGFQRLEGDPDALDTVYTANGITAVTVGSDAYTLVADTWTKVGMWFNRNDVRLGWIVAVLNGEAVQSTVDLDWVRVAQRRVLSATNP